MYLDGSWLAVSDLSVYVPTYLGWLISYLRFEIVIVVFVGTLSNRSSIPDATAELIFSTSDDGKVTST